MYIYLGYIYWEYTLPSITDFSHKPPQKVTCRTYIFCLQPQNVTSQEKEA